jgi:hypothetical protein
LYPPNKVTEQKTKLPKWQQGARRWDEQVKGQTAAVTRSVFSSNSFIFWSAFFFARFNMAHSFFSVCRSTSNSA